MKLVKELIYLSMKTSILPHIIPAILSNSVEDYIKQASEMVKFSPVIHIDVMDGKYVHTKSPAIQEIMDALAHVPAHYCVHLMVADPSKYVQQLKLYTNVTLVYVHVEFADQISNTENLPFSLAWVVNPDSDLEKYKSILVSSQDIQIMAVQPGTQGAKFIPEDLDNITKLREAGYTGRIHIDGHVSEETIHLIEKFQPDVLNVGSAIAHSNNLEESYKKLVVLSSPRQF
jgi:pentose-5-phosphate-3-epimerase